MPYTLKIKEEARADIIEAAAWYRDKSDDLEKRFVAAVGETFKLIQRNPFAYKRGYKNCREAGIRKFPYLVIYKVEKREAIVFAVFNTWQHPKKKIRRLKK